MAGGAVDRFPVWPPSRDNEAMNPVRALALWLALGCSGGPAPEDPPNSPQMPPSGRAHLALDQGWNITPWGQGRPRPRADAGGPIELKTTLVLPRQLALDGARLHLPGAWLHVSATVNGQGIGPVRADLAGAILPLGGALRAGTNEIALSLTGQDTPGRAHNGGLLSSRFDARRAHLLSPPWLELAPATGLSGLALRGEGSTGAVATVNPPAGATQVRLWTALDGQTRQDLGTHPVGTGPTQVAVPRFADRWDVGAAQLVWLWAEALDAQAQVIDRHAIRTAARSVAQSQDGALRIDGQPRQFVGITLRPEWDQLPALLGTLSNMGVNGLEFHGTHLPPAWLDMADELGVPVAVMPRCIGRSPPGTPHADLAAGDAHTIDRLAAHPSVLTWVMEGKQSLQEAPVDRALWTRAFEDEPLARPIVGQDIVGRPLRVGQPDYPCQGDRCAHPWITEVTAEDGQRTPGAFAERLAQGGPGGVIGPLQHEPGSPERDQWMGLLAQSLAPLQDTVRPSGNARAAAALQVTGLQPGQTVWLSAPLMPTLGTRANPQGIAELAAWTAGSATLWADGQPHPVQLQAGQWQAFRLQAPPTVLDLAP